MLADTHAHLDMPQFDADRHTVVQRALESGVGLIVTIATAKPGGRSVEQSIELAEKHEHMFVGAGVHPHDARLVDDRYWSVLERWIAHPKVVLWGEIGLDYFYEHSPRAAQRKVFHRQLRLAREHGLPVSIHCRDAWQDLVEILQAEGGEQPCRGVMHSFTGNREQAMDAVARGLLVSFSGMITFRNAEGLRDAARSLPPESIVLETDSPYLAPVPHRGRRNEPAFLAAVAGKIAECRGISLQSLALQTTSNARRLLRLDRGDWRKPDSPVPGVTTGPAQ